MSLFKFTLCPAIYFHLYHHNSLSVSRPSPYKLRPPRYSNHMTPLLDILWWTELKSYCKNCQINFSYISARQDERRMSVIARHWITIYNGRFIQGDVRKLNYRGLCVQWQVRKVPLYGLASDHKTGKRYTLFFYIFSFRNSNWSFCCLLLEKNRIFDSSCICPVLDSKVVDAKISVQF